MDSNLNGPDPQQWYQYKNNWLPVPGTGTAGVWEDIAQRSSSHLDIRLVLPTPCTYANLDYFLNSQKFFAHTGSEMNSKFWE
jgi:hypothetical protein